MSIEEIVLESIKRSKEDAIKLFGEEKIGTPDLRNKLGPEDKVFLTNWLLTRAKEWVITLSPRVNWVKVAGEELREI